MQGPIKEHHILMSHEISALESQNSRVGVHAFGVKVQSGVPNHAAPAATGPLLTRVFMLIGSSVVYVHAGLITPHTTC